MSSVSVYNMQITPFPSGTVIMPGEWLPPPRKWASYCHCPGADRAAVLAEQEVVNRLDPVPARWREGGGREKESSASKAAH